MKADERIVNRNVDVALGVMGFRVVEEPDEPIANIWQETRGACLAYSGFMPSCPVEWCRFHVCSEMRGDAIEKLPPDRDTCVLRMASFAHTLEEVGQAFCVTRERIRQIELMALSRVGLGLVKIGAVSQDEIDMSRLAKIRSCMHAHRLKKVNDDQRAKMERGDAQ